MTGAIRSRPKKLNPGDSITLAILPHGASKPRYVIINTRLIIFVFSILISLLAFTVASLVWRLVSQHAITEKTELQSVYASQVSMALQKEREIIQSLRAFQKEGSKLHETLWGFNSDLSLHQGKNFSDLYKRRTTELQQVVVFLAEREKVLQAMPTGMPLENAFITSVYGKRISPFGFEINFHTGIDFAAPTGTPVLATADGYVVHSGPGGGYGNHVIIDHAHGFQTLYAHMTHTNVPLDSTVKRGDVIGFLGMTGSATGPHVHYEIRLINRDPFQYLQLTLNPWPFVKESL